MMHRRHGRLVALSVVGLLVLAGCGLQWNPHRSRAFITSDGRMLFDPAELPAGEAIIEVINGHPEPHLPVLIRLDGEELDALTPDGDGSLPVGPYGEAGWRGEGYTVLQVLDEMRSFSYGQTQVRAVIHRYLHPGTYALVDALPGRFADGWVAELVVTRR